MSYLKEGYPGEIIDASIPQTAQQPSADGGRDDTAGFPLPAMRALKGLFERESCTWGDSSCPASSAARSISPTKSSAGSK